METATLTITVRPEAATHRRHGRHCAGHCITRAYALASLGIAAVVALHVALGW